MLVLGTDLLCTFNLTLYYDRPCLWYRLGFGHREHWFKYFGNFDFLFRHKYCQRVLAWLQHTLGFLKCSPIFLGDFTPKYVYGLSFDCFYAVSHNQKDIGCTFCMNDIESSDIPVITERIKPTYLSEMPYSMCLLMVDLMVRLMVDLMVALQHSSICAFLLLHITMLSWFRMTWITD